LGISITPYPVRGSKFTYSPGQGGGFTQKFHVQGLDPTKGANPALAAFATDASTGVFIPIYATPHPDVPNFFVAMVESEAFPEDSRTACMVTVTYRPPEYIPAATLIEIVGSNGNRLYSRWTYGPQKGQPMIVGYSPNPTSFPSPIDPASISLNHPPPFYDIHSISILDPGTVLRYTRRENGSPLTKSLTYRRKVNSQPFQGQAKGLWLCRHLGGRNIVEGGNYVAPGFYNVVYEFLYDPDGHTHVLLYKNNLDGSIPPNIKFDGSNNGYQLCVPYPPVDFNNLNLPTAL
jgi:hypothetical protein